MQRATGYLRDEPDDRDWPVERLLGAPVSASSLPLEFSLPQLIDIVFDQGIWGSCVAQAIVMAIAILWTIGGAASPPIVSRWALYWWARAAAGMTSTDAGAYPRLAFEALMENGYPLETEMPYEGATAYDAPPLNVSRGSYDQREAIEYYRIPDSDDRLLRIKQALLAGHPVTIGISVDHAFNEYRNGIWIYTGPTLGRHYVTVVGWYANSLLIKNSWGKRWGWGGFCWVSGETVRDTVLCTDPYVITFAKQVSG